MDRAIGPQHQAPASALGAPEVGGKAGGSPHGRRLRWYDSGRRHKEIAGRRFIDIPREKPGDLHLNGLVTRVGEVDLGAPKVARTSLEVEGENR